MQILQLVIQYNLILFFCNFFLLDNWCYQVFFDDFYLPALLKYRWHRFHMIILGKQHTGNDRQLIKPGEFHTIQDFAERLTL